MQICSTVFLVCALGLQAQDTSALRGLPPGKAVKITTRGGEVVRGRLLNISDAGQISLRDRRQVTLADVREVQIERRRRLHSAGWGALAGFGVGFVIGALSAGHLADRNNPPATTRIGFGAGLGMFGAGIGAAIGALSAPSRDEVIYRSDK